MSHRFNDITALGVIAGLSSVASLYDPMRGAPGLSVDEFGAHMHRTALRGYRDFQRPNPPPRTPKQKRKAARRAKAKAGRKAAHVGRLA